MKNNIEVKKVGGKWAVLLNGKVHEGGFFAREAARHAALELDTELTAAKTELREFKGVQS